LFTNWQQLKDTIHIFLLESQRKCITKGEEENIILKSENTQLKHPIKN